jgi:putative transposase
VNQRGFGDGTEIDTAEGTLQPASVLDVGSRRILGFALSEHHDAELAYGSLAMTVAVRGGQIAGVIMHTDRGSEYTATLFRAACARLGITQSMARPGSAPGRHTPRAGRKPAPPGARRGTPTRTARSP